MSSDEFHRLPGPRGLDIELLSTDLFKTVQLMLVIEAPLDERRSARALLPDLLSRGTQSFPDLASLGARCEELFDTEIVAHASAVGGRQVLRLGVETVADRAAGQPGLVDEAAALLAEVLHGPPLREGRFREDDLAQERRNLERALAGLQDDKGAWSEWRLMQLMHAGTPWASHAWGTLEQAGALTEPEVRAAWDDVRLRLPARLFVVGDVSEEQARRLAEVIAADADRAPCSAPLAAPDSLAGGPRREVEHQDLNQAKLALGFRLPGDALVGAAPGLFGEIFGGSATSRLFKRVREDAGLAYGCSAVALPDCATLLVQAGIPPGSGERVESLVAEELARLGEELVPEEEFEQARAGLRRRLRGSMDRPAARLGFRLRGLMTGRATRLSQALEQLEAVSPAEVRALAAACKPDSSYLLERSKA